MNGRRWPPTQRPRSALGDWLGAAIGCWITRIEGRAVARHARQADETLTILPRALEASGVFELNRSPDGRITGIVHHLSVTRALAPAGSITLTVKPAPQGGGLDSPTKPSDVAEGA